MKIIIIISIFFINLFGNIIIKPQSIYEIKKTILKIGVNGTLQKGNTQKQSIGFGTNIITGDGKKYKNLFLANYNYGKSNNIKDTNKGLFHYRFTHLIKNNYDYELFTQEEFNEYKYPRLTSNFSLKYRTKVFQKY